MGYKPTRTVHTESSTWLFDEVEMHYVRMPRIESGYHPNIPYTNEWEPYLSVRDFKDRQGCGLTVERPVPHGSGRFRKTGIIIYDSSKENPDAGDI